MELAEVLELAHSARTSMAASLAGLRECCLIQSFCCLTRLEGRELCHPLRRSGMATLLRCLMFCFNGTVESCNRA